MRQNWLLPLLVLVAFTLILSACAAGPNTVVHTMAADGEIAGFWLGWWHGLIAPFSLLFSLFEPTINMYEIHNNGPLYNLGFCIGAGMLFGGGASAASRRRS